MRIRSSGLCVGALAIACAAGLASADTVFNFTYSDNAGTTATGSLVAADMGGGVFAAFSGVLNVTSGPLTGGYSLFANPNSPSVVTSASGAFNYDDLLYPASDPHLDGWGLLFVGGPDPLNHTEVNIWGNYAQNYSGWTHGISGYDYSNDNGLFTLEEVGQASAVPLPAAAWCGLGGLAGVGGLGAMRRRTLGRA